MSSLTLTDQIAADGDTPWCIGIETEAATGWPATDWTEELMLRTTTLENYDKWVTGELNFDLPEVERPSTNLSELWLNPAFVFGGKEAICRPSLGTPRRRCSRTTEMLDAQAGQLYHRLLPRRFEGRRRLRLLLPAGDRPRSKVSPTS